ncbi:MAG: dihydrolipoamide acetyltransferase family protein [Wenzhouxiangella sp.]|nr:dihydrolipoamide acetyltransferase family protein [Wenzhouxiangella sp.]MDR9452419.1 dihydrolipoamide acetyltransferase family protein [Wenzhouxiangella sp.]
MKTFHLPDLGEGLPDAEIVEWLVSEGDSVELDQPMVSMETAKAVVEVPSPYKGQVVTLHGQAGDVIKTGAPLADFKVEGSAETDAASSDDQPSQAGASDEAEKVDHTAADRQDSGTVVGNVESGNEVLTEHLSTAGGHKMTPAVRALAKKLKVDPADCTPTGRDGVITLADVKQAAKQGPTHKTTRAPASAPAPAVRPPVEGAGEWLPVRGTRRAMARSMVQSHAQVVPTTLMDDADIHRWSPAEDMTVRLLRALWVASQHEPGLNAWFDGENDQRMIHQDMHVGVAVDTPDGLMVAALRHVNQKNAQQLRDDVNRLREQSIARSIPPEEMKDYTIMLSNFGKFAGRYATPVIAPPCVAIVAAGAVRHEVVPVMGGIETHRVMPISLTFDHRAVTGGEAARFLSALLKDLSAAS